MPVFLFHDVIFGPIRSRRLGLSLGINLLPSHAKYCSYNCIYCECGWTEKIPGDDVELPSREQVKEFLEHKLIRLTEEDYLPDTVTYAGNGEPTLHPDFPGIVDDTIVLRDKYAPDAKIAVLSNASMIGDPRIFTALLKTDLNIQKLDCGSEQMFRMLNNPVDPGRFREIIEDLKKFGPRVIIQSLFVRGVVNGFKADNTTEEEIRQWLNLIGYIRPGKVMIYSIERATPAHKLVKIPQVELEKIANSVRKLEIEVEVY